MIKSNTVDLQLLVKSCDSFRDALCQRVFFVGEIRWCRFSHHQAWGKISFMDVKITERTFSICVLDLKTAQWSIKQVMSSCKNRQMTYRILLKVSDLHSTCYPHRSKCLQTDLCLHPKAKRKLCTCFPSYRLLPGSLIYIAPKKNIIPKGKYSSNYPFFRGYLEHLRCNRIKKARSQNRHCRRCQRGDRM